MIFKRFNEKQPLRTKLYGKQEFFFFHIRMDAIHPAKTQSFVQFGLFKSKNRKKSLNF